MTIKASNFPTTRPSLDLNFAQTKRLDPRVTFSRASSGTYTDVDGLIKSAATNVARFDHNPTTGESLGLLVEEARTNHVPNSLFEAGLDGGRGWNSPSGATLIKNSTLALAPDGTFTAVFLKEDSTNGAHSQQWTGINPNSFMTLSVFVKPVGRSSISISFWNSGSATFNLSTETVAVGQGTASIQKHNNGWYRLFLTSSAAMPQQNYGNFVISLGSYAGDSASGVLLWGVSYEAGSFPTSYIPTPATFTGRSSTATFYDSAGVIQTAASGVARSNAFFPDSSGVMRPAGLLLEAAGTNLLLRSQEIDNTTIWSGNYKLNYSANATTAPDGTATADKAIPNTENASHSTTQDPAGTISGTYTFSLYAKASGYNKIYLWIDGAGAGGLFGSGSALFDLSTKAITSISGNAAIETLPNGWYRCSVTGTSASAVTVSTGFGIYDNSGNSTFIGNGTDGIFVWGAQLEASSYATSYIPTVASTVTRAADTSTSATVTRSADVAQITGTNFSSWYRQDQGTIFTNVRILESSPSFDKDYGAWFGKGSNSSSGIRHDYQADFAALDVYSNSNNLTRVSSTISPVLRKAASALQDSSFAFCINGSLGTQSTGTLSSTIDRLLFGGYNNVNGQNKTISRLTYWPTRLSNATLQAITR